MWLMDNYKTVISYMAGLEEASEESAEPQKCGRKEWKCSGYKIRIWISYVNENFFQNLFLGIWKLYLVKILEA